MYVYLQLYRWTHLVFGFAYCFDTIANPDTVRLKIFVLANFPFKSQLFNFIEQSIKPQHFNQIFLTQNKATLDSLLVFFLSYSSVNILYHI